MDTVLRLQRWYTAQCDGDWEHDWGVRIGTLDNPGWRVEINLAGTDLEDALFTEVSRSDSDVEWIRCWIEGQRFHGAGGAPMLGEILTLFLDWVEDADRKPDTEGAGSDSK